MIMHFFELKSLLTVLPIDISLIDESEVASSKLGYTIFADLEAAVAKLKKNKAINPEVITFLYFFIIFFLLL